LAIVLKDNKFVLFFIFELKQVWKKKKIKFCEFWSDSCWRLSLLYCSLFLHQQYTFSLEMFSFFCFFQCSCVTYTVQAEWSTPGVGLSFTYSLLICNHISLMIYLSGHHYLFTFNIDFILSCVLFEMPMNVNVMYFRSWSACDLRGVPRVLLHPVVHAWRAAHFTLSDQWRCSWKGVI